MTGQPASWALVCRQGPGSPQDDKLNSRAGRGTGFEARLIYNLAATKPPLFSVSACESRRPASWRRRKEGEINSANTDKLSWRQTLVLT